jgi:hypothetical protein
MKMDLVFFTLCAMLYAICDVLINTKLPEKNRKEQMDHFKDQAKDLMEIRKSDHLPDDGI